MKTVLHTADKILKYENGYSIDGILQPLGELQADIWHLEVVETEQPEILENQFTTSEFLPDFENNKYVQVWTVHTKTAEEIRLEEWKHLDYEKRIVAPISLIMDDIGAKIFAWFQINGLPVVKKDADTVYLYCNEILQEHQSLVDTLQGIIKIETK